jgi:cytochrome c biogenesis protein CcdA
MLPLEPVTLSMTAAFVLGLGFGSGPCNIACLPFLGPVFVATGEDVHRAWRILLPFSLGRLAGYALLGAVAGWAGLLVQEWIAAPWVRWLLGAATVVVALSLLWRLHRRRAPCAASSTGRQISVSFDGTGKREPLLPGGLFLMGAGMALNPCAPLTTVILAAATAASLSAGMALGIGFGMGAVIIPALIFAFGVARFGHQLSESLSQWRGALEKGSIALLIFMGVGTAFGWIAI